MFYLGELGKFELVHEAILHKCIQQVTYIAFCFVYLFAYLSIYLFIYLFIVSLMLTITKQILFTIKNSNKMLIDVKPIVKKPIEHKIFYKKMK